MHMCCIVPGYERKTLDDDDDDFEEVRFFFFFFPGTYFMMHKYIKYFHLMFSLYFLFYMYLKIKKCIVTNCLALCSEGGKKEKIHLFSLIFSNNCKFYRISLLINPSNFMTQCEALSISLLQKVHLFCNLFQF